MLLKIAYGKEIHLYNGEVSLTALKAFSLRTFYNLPDHFSFSYIDQEGDRITVSTPEDFCMVGASENKKAIKIFIQEDEKFQLLPVYADLKQEIAIQTTQDEEVYVDLVHQFLEQISQKTAKAAEQECYVLTARDFLSSLGAKAIDSALEEEMYLTVAQNFLSEVHESAIRKVLEEEMYCNVVQNFISEVSQKAINNVIEAEENLTNQIAGDYLSNLYEQTIEKVAQEEERLVANRLSIRKTSKIMRPKSVVRQVQMSQEDYINSKVEEKLQQLLPTIIKKVTKVVESKFSKASCVKCDRSQTSVEKLISRQLFNKYKIREQKSLQKLRSENPQC